MSNNSKIHIPYDSLESHIQCAICLSVIRGAVLTPCGHRYCNRCITEWVERNHRCPCCNSNLNSQQFYYDVQFDTLVEEVLLQRDKAEQAYFDLMFSQVSVNIDGSANKSAFEEILKKHMKSSLLSYKQNFDHYSGRVLLISQTLNRLQEEYQRKIDLLDKGLNTMILVDGQNLAGTNLKDVIEKNFKESERLAAEAFDRYLTDNVPSLEILPVTVSVYLADKDVRLPDIIIKPSDSLVVLKQLVENAMLARCDPLIKWNDEGGTLLLFGPLSKNTTYNISDVTNNLTRLQDVHQLTWESRPIFQCQMRPGSEIVLCGVFTTESDISKHCFANVFQETGSQPVDYFQCHTCNLKWICKSCIQLCHAGHSMSPFALKHSPTWACCYCPKKKLCKIQDK